MKITIEMTEKLATEVSCVARASCNPRLLRLAADIRGRFDDAVASEKEYREKRRRSLSLCWHTRPGSWVCVLPHQHKVPHRYGRGAVPFGLLADLRKRNSKSPTPVQTDRQAKGASR